MMDDVVRDFLWRTMVHEWILSQHVIFPTGIVKCGPENENCFRNAASLTHSLTSFCTFDQLYVD